MGMKPIWIPVHVSGFDSSTPVSSREPSCRADVAYVISGRRVCATIEFGYLLILLGVIRTVVGATQMARLSLPDGRFLVRGLKVGSIL